jgi:hypothetical protein
MKQVKYNGSKWILLTPDGGFFNPQSEVYFYSSEQGKIAKLVKQTVKDIEIDVIYQVPDSGIYTQVCGPQCGPFWPNVNCNSCGGTGVGASFDDSGFQMGGTDIGNQEIENIKNGNSNIHPEL